MSWAFLKITIQMLLSPPLNGTPFEMKPKPLGVRPLRVKRLKLKSRLLFVQGEVGEVKKATLNSNSVHESTKVDFCFVQGGPDVPNKREQQAVLSAEREHLNNHQHHERRYQESEGEDQKCGEGHRGSEQEAE